MALHPSSLSLFERYTACEKSWIRNDPVAGWCRNQSMISASNSLVDSQQVRSVRTASPAVRANVSAAKPAKAGSPDTKLLIAVRDQRSKAAFAALFDSFAPRLKAVVIRSGTAHAQAEEIVQDAMLSVWQKAHQFDEHRAEASAWIYRIARNRMIDVARRDARPVPEELKMEPDLVEDSAQITGVSEETALLRQALAKLPEKQRKMIEAAYMGELSHQEINEATGLPLGTIKSRIRLGIERLRKELKDMR